MKHASIVFILGILSALTVQWLIHTSGMQTTVDALMFNFTIHGRDIGESFEAFSRTFFPDHTNSNVFWALYLVGYNITEEIVKFGFFVLAVLLLKPITTRDVLYTGMLIWAGFATIEHFSTETISWYVFPLRLAGHMLFTAVIALWYSFGSFARMRWIDDGAQWGIMSFLLSRWSGFVMTIWIISGIFIAALFHSFVNLFASAWHYMAVIIEAVGWIGIIYFLLNNKSERPYGRILYEIKLMKHLHTIQHELNKFQYIYPKPVANPSHFQVRKLRFSRNQLAK